MCVCVCVCVCHISLSERVIIFRVNSDSRVILRVTKCISVAGKVNLAFSPQRFSRLYQKNVWTLLNFCSIFVSFFKVFVFIKWFSFFNVFVAFLQYMQTCHGTSLDGSWWPVSSVG